MEPSSSAFERATSNPSLVFAGAEAIGAIIDKIAEHAILQWIVDQLAAVFGGARVLNSVVAHPFYAYAVLVLLWVMFVFLWPRKRPLRTTVIDEGTPINSQRVDIHGDSNKVAQAGSVKAKDHANVVVGDGSVDASTHYHTVLRSTPPRIAFIKAGPIPADDELSNGAQTGFHLANDGEEAAYEVQVESFQIEPSVWADSAKLPRIAGKPGTAFALVWLRGFPHTQFAIGKWRLLEAMAKATTAAHGLSIYQPTYTVSVAVRYKDANAKRYRTRAELAYIPSQHRLQFSNPIYEELSNDDAELIEPTFTPFQQPHPVPALVDTGNGVVPGFKGSLVKEHHIFGIRNEQIDARVTAYNVRVVLRYTHANGIDKFIVDPAAWIVDSSHPGWQPSTESYADLGSGQRARVVIAVTMKGDDKARTMNPPPGAVSIADGGKILQYGRWAIHGTVISDNCDQLEVRYGLQIDEHGNVTSWAMPEVQSLGYPR